MDLTELSGQLSVDDLAELFARKMLNAEQSMCKQIIDDTLHEDIRAEYRRVLSSAEELRTASIDAAAGNYFGNTYGDFAVTVFDKIGEFAEEYVRDC